MSDREEFEKALAGEVSLRKDKDGSYTWREAQAAWLGWQAARAQSGQGVEVVPDFQAEIRTERDFSDEYNSYLAFISGGKSHPYMYIPESLDQEVLDEALRRLNTHPQPAVPKGWKLVPVVSTSEMDIAAHDKGIMGVSRDEAEIIWNVMLHAAPQPPQEGEGDEQV